MSEGGRRFFLQKRLGAGAFGEVYLAEQDSGAGFRRRVAIKLLNPDVAGIAEVGRRMRDEARILGLLSHRNIVTVFDLAKLSGQWAVIMDYVRGVDLDRLLEALERDDKYIPAPVALEIGAAVAEALHAAFHTEDGRGGTLGVVHRDIKPSNVLLTGDGDVKVLDFGVARMNLDTRESKTGIQVGTVRYMSPMRLCGEEEGPPGDVYAVAASVAELLLRRPIGRSPVEDTRHAEFVEAALAEIRELVDGPPEAREALLTLLRRSLHSEPEERPSARQLGNAFAELARLLPGPTLAAFAQETVPPIEEALVSGHETVDRVLSESGPKTDALSGVTGPTLGPEKTTAPENATLADFGDPPPPRRALPLVLLGLGGLAGVAAIATIALVAVVAFGLGGRTSGSEVEASVTTVAPESVGEAAAVAEPEVPPPTEADPIEAEATTATVEPDPPVEAAGTASEAVEPPPRTPPPKRTTPKTTAEPPPPAADAPRISRAMVVMQDASAVEVKCGTVVARGTASARITDFPAGTCRVRATFLGQELATDVIVDRPREITCTAASGSLVCP